MTRSSFESTNLAAEEWDTALRMPFRRHAASSASARRARRWPDRMGATSRARRPSPATPRSPSCRPTTPRSTSVRAVNRCWKAERVRGAPECAPAPNSVAAIETMIALCHSPVRPATTRCAGPRGSSRVRATCATTRSTWSPRRSRHRRGATARRGRPAHRRGHPGQHQRVEQRHRPDGADRWSIRFAGSTARSPPTRSPAATTCKIGRGRPRACALGLLRSMTIGRDLTSVFSAPAPPAPTAGAHRANSPLARHAQVERRPSRPAARRASRSRALLCRPAAEARRKSEAAARIALAKGTPTEAALVTPAWLDMAGVDKNVTHRRQRARSRVPLRSLDGETIAKLEQKVNSSLAAQGQCLMQAPEPNGITALAKIMAKKFPYIRHR